MARAARLTLASLAGATLAAYAALRVLGRMAGTTSAERRQRLPGDELVDSAMIVTEHAIDVARAPEEVWPWLAQLGWHLGGYYTRSGSTGFCSPAIGRVWTGSTLHWCATCGLVT